MNKIKKLKVINNSTRNTFLPNYSATLSDHKPEKGLLRSLKKTTGRNNSGKITVRHRGGASTRKYRVIDFKRNKINMFAKIKTIEYDPNRSCFISLAVYVDGAKKYILTPKGLKVGDTIISGEDVKVQTGNALPLYKIPEGILVHNVELRPKQGAKLIRSAGAFAQVMGMDDTKKYMILKLSSGETRKILKNCFATVGTVGNEERRLIKYGKAGRKRWLGFRPTVRGAAMNAVDHPHGGGEGKAPIGRPSPYTKWGKKGRGVVTRKKNKFSSKLILRRRNDKK